MNIWSFLANESDQRLPHIVRQAHPLSLRIPVVLAAGQSQRLEIASQRFCSIICQMMTGAFDVCLSDSPEAMPDFRFQSALGPQQVYLPYLDYVVSVRNPLTVTSQGVIRILGGGDG